MIGRLVASALRDLMPGGGALPGVGDTGLEPFVAQLRREADPLFVTGLYLGTLLYVVSPPFTVGVPLPSPLLSPAARDRHARRLCNSRIYAVRQGVTVLRLAAGMCWGMHPRVREALGMAPCGADPGTFRQGDEAGPGRRLRVQPQGAP